MTALPKTIAPGALQSIKVCVSGTPFPNASSNDIGRALKVAGATQVSFPDSADLAIAFDPHERIFKRDNKTQSDVPRLGPAAAAAVLEGRLSLPAALRRMSDFPLLWKCSAVLANIRHEEREAVVLATELAGATVLSGFGHGERRYVLVVGDDGPVATATATRAFRAGAIRIDAADLLNIHKLAARGRIRLALGDETPKAISLVGDAPRTDDFAPAF